MWNALSHHFAAETSGKPRKTSVRIFALRPLFRPLLNVSTRNNCELGKRHSKRGKMETAKGGGARLSTVCLSMRSVTENIYCSQLSSVAILLQTEPDCFTSYTTRKGLRSLSLCAIALRSSPPFHVSTCNGQRSSQLLCVHYSRNAIHSTGTLCVTGCSGWWWMLCQVPWSFDVDGIDHTRISVPQVETKKVMMHR
jgi:hypothetical protein